MFHSLYITKGRVLNRLQTYASHSIAFNRNTFLLCNPVTLTFWPNIKCVARTIPDASLVTVVSAVFRHTDRQTRMNAILPWLSSAWVMKLILCTIQLLASATWLFLLHGCAKQFLIIGTNYLGGNNLSYDQKDKNISSLQYISDP